MSKLFHLFPIVFLILISPPCNAEWLSAETYEDCILKNIEKAKTTESVEAIKKACKEKFPKIFNFEQIAKDAGVKSWQTVSSNPKYLSLSAEDKAKAQSQYFKDVITPNVHPDFIYEAKKQFFQYVRSVKKNITQ